MKFAALGSGSQGNGLIVESGGCRVLVDCGFSLTETLRRLNRLDLQPGDLNAILVTHEHDDHVGGVARLASKFSIPVWMTPGTLRGMEETFQSCHVQFIEGYRAFAVGALQVTPYPVPHDAREPAQFVFAYGGHRLGLLTDAGSVTPYMIEQLQGCDALLLEFNHDERLLRSGRYPEPLKRRIASRVGHLDNSTAAKILRAVDVGQTQMVVAMHLSQENNHPDLVRAAMRDSVGTTPERIEVACQTEGTPWLAIN
jgi:phosphoribosyl 1,2-cyclic phosphodiesterase